MDKTKCPICKKEIKNKKKAVYYMGVHYHEKCLGSLKKFRPFEEVFN